MQTKWSDKGASCTGEVQKQLSDEMRRVWLEHMMWTRMVVISIVDGLEDIEEATNRLLQNPGDLAALFEPYYGARVSKAIQDLVTEHLVIGADLIKALRAGNSEAADRLNKEWYGNADKMAEAFSAINPFFDQEEMRQMFYSHLELTTREVAARLQKDYAADVAAYDEIEKQGLAMADDFTAGIVKQFPRIFCQGKR